MGSLSAKNASENFSRLGTFKSKQLLVRKLQLHLNSYFYLTSKKQIMYLGKYRQFLETDLELKYGRGTVLVCCLIQAVVTLAPPPAFASFSWTTADL
jgi:hypothetical protein